MKSDAFLNTKTNEGSSPVWINLSIAVIRKLI